LGHHSKFQWVSRVGFVTAATSLNGSQPNFVRCLAVSWADTLYLYFRRLLTRNGFTLRSCLALSYIGSVTARHSSSGRQPNFAALNRGRHLYSAGRPSRWALARILVLQYFNQPHAILYRISLITVAVYNEMAVLCGMPTIQYSAQSARLYVR